MTLLVGAIFPSEELLERAVSRALRQLSNQIGLIIAADSRWTFPSGRPEDGAVKVFGVHANGLGAYAGSVAAGEDVIIGLSSEALSTTTMTEFTSRVRSIISRAWQAHQPNEDGLEILFGYSFASGMAWLGHFSSVDDFTPHEVRSMKVIGPESAVVHFKQALRAATIENMERAETSGQSISIDSSASLVVAVINDVCELQTHHGVGGKILCAVTMLGRPRGIGVTRLGPGASGITVEEIGLESSEGRTLRPGFEYVAPPEANT